MAHSGIALWLLAGCGGSLLRGAGAAGNRWPPPLVEASVWSPENLRGSDLGRAAAFSALPVPSGTLHAWTPTADPNGCAEYNLPANGRVALVVLVRHGGCSYLRKALRAQEAGAAGVVVVGQEGPVLMTAGEEAASARGVDILAVSVGAAFGQPLLRQLEGAPGGDVVAVSFKVYKPHFKGISLAVLIAGATALVVLGACFSTADLRRRVVVTVVGPSVGPPPPQLAGPPVAGPQRWRQKVHPHLVDASPQGPPQNHGEIRSIDGLIFCVGGSCMLVALYFFMQYLIYAVVAIFCVTGFAALLVIGSWLLQRAAPSLGRPACKGLPPMVFVADLLVAPVAAALVLCWLWLQGTDASWALQDVIGIAFLVLVQQALQLPNLKVATIVLSVMFCFDIFWVFISPLLFQRSVMVKVATSPVRGLKVPMLLRVPSFTDPFGRDRMLGFGDVAAPGLLVSYLLRWDLWSKRGLLCGYFLPAVVGYCVGLCVTVAAVLAMHKGQPALLYLVPGTLGLTLLLSTCRGDLASLWRGLPEDYDACCQDDRGLPVQVLHQFPPDPRLMEVQRIYQP
uniref:PA domain-containing protein n=1 Tax=Alexandrium monilatum TaxID=311494 RepID=A0A7S4R100_9DINO|mmetsp:Transcript_101960/g.323972  ORF Transcript_101960/g.323972 Transcript_101960/m.323972 type:complete len:566 (-) Transcript_101960:20-1717(-)